MSIMLREKDVAFRIDHSSGFVEVQIDGFFPCAIPQGKKLFKMARKFCTVQEQQELYHELRALADRLPDKIREAGRELGDPKLDGHDFEAVLTKLRLLRNDRTKLALNIRDAAGIMEVQVTDG